MMSRFFLLKKTARWVALGALSLGLVACETLSSGASSTGSATSNGATADIIPAAHVTSLTKKRYSTDSKLEVYVGTTQPDKGRAARRDDDPVIKVGDISYYTTGVVLQKEDVRHAFVAKTNYDEPALALRLSDDAAKRLNQARRGYNHILAHVNGVLVSVVEGQRGDLTDGVLLLPMPTLVSARDAADILRRK